MGKKNRVVETVSSIGSTKKRLSDFLGADVGYLKETTGPQEYPNGWNLASNAALHELGSADGSTPPRDFMRQGSDLFEGQKSAIGGVVARVAEGKASPTEGSNALGVLLQGSVRRAITRGNFAPLDPKTIARKGSSKPLIDSGALRGGVDVRTK